MATTTTPDLDARLHALLDRDAIAELVHRLGAALDEGDGDSLRALLRADVTATTPGGHAEGVDAVLAQAQRNHDPAASIQHLITDVVVDLDGDAAQVRANLVVTFADRPGDPTPTRQQGSRYRFDVDRTAEGWRFTSIGTTPIWSEPEG